VFEMESRQKAGTNLLELVQVQGLSNSILWIIYLPFGTLKPLQFIAP